MIFLYILLFLVSCLVLFWSGAKLVGYLTRIAEYLHWREFVVAFFVMAAACSIPNLFVGINSALSGIPQLSFGDIVGGNVINLTLVVGLAVLVSGTALPAESKMVQSSIIYLVIIAVLPLLLMADGMLSRADGVILILSFFVYVFWLFSKEERFKKVYDDKDYNSHGIKEGFWGFLSNFSKMVFVLLLLLAASAGIVRSAMMFSVYFNVPLVLIGIVVVGLGDTIPEMYFSIVSARKKQNWLILGDLVGSVIYTSTFVLGTVALIHPIETSNQNSFLIGRIFLVISAILFLVFTRTGKKITIKEAIYLVFVYILFLFAEIFFR
jgi:cation:H+ antiporter